MVELRRMSAHNPFFEWHACWALLADCISLRRERSAQTERRGGAGPVRGVLSDKHLTGRFLQPRDQSSFRIVPMPRFLVNSELLLLPNRSR